MRLYRDGIVLNEYSSAGRSFLQRWTAMKSKVINSTLCCGISGHVWIIRERYFVILFLYAPFCTYLYEYDIWNCCQSVLGCIPFSPFSYKFASFLYVFFGYSISSHLFFRRGGFPEWYQVTFDVPRDYSPFAKFAPIRIPRILFSLHSSRCLIFGSLSK